MTTQYEARQGKEGKGKGKWVWHCELMDYDGWMHCERRPVRSNRIRWAQSNVIPTWLARERGSALKLLDLVPSSLSNN